MFELDGRHFKSYCGKDYLDHLFGHADTKYKALEMDDGDRISMGEVRTTLVEGQVNLLRRDQVRTDQRVNVVVARAAEEADAVWNEK